MSNENLEKLSAEDAINCDSPLDPNKPQIIYTTFSEESQLLAVKDLIDKELSEPYSIYTYRYFIYNWPHLCYLACRGDKYVGVIVCKIDTEKDKVTGYIAMLAVETAYRQQKIGRTLVEKAVDAMIAENVEMISLETELSNKAALRLYESLGFIRETRMMRYYMNDSDAMRLKLLLKPC